MMLDADVKVYVEDTETDGGDGDDDGHRLNLLLILPFGGRKETLKMMLMLLKMIVMLMGLFRPLTVMRGKQLKRMLYQMM